MLTGTHTNGKTRTEAGSKESGVGPRRPAGSAVIPDKDDRGRRKTALKRRIRVGIGKGHVRRQVPDQAQGGALVMAPAGRARLARAGGGVQAGAPRRRPHRPGRGVLRRDRLRRDRAQRPRSRDMTREEFPSRVLPCHGKCPGGANSRFQDMRKTRDAGSPIRPQTGAYSQ